VRPRPEDRWRYGVGGLMNRLGRALRIAVIGTVVLSSIALGCSDAKSTAEGLVASGDLAGAETIYKEVLAEDPEDLEALNGLAVTLMLEGKHDEAVAIQERVVAADPTDVQTRIELGFNYLNYQDRADDAVRVLGEAAALNGSAKNLTFLAQAQSVAGKKDEAETTLRRALEVDPQYAYSYRVLVGILEKDLRLDDAAEIRDLAASRGVHIEDAQ
jgi:tetratricopeptide (TPR) repeat protein